MKKEKILFILLIAIFLTVAYSINAYATDGVIQGADDFLSSGNKEILNNKAIKKVSDTVFNMFFSVGLVIIVIIAAILGIKFMIGSVEEKAEIKESITPYVLGAVVIFAAVSIWAISVKIFQNIF